MTMLGAAAPVVPSPPSTERQAPVATWIHTVILAGIFIALAVAGALVQGRARANPAPLAHPSVIPLYLSLISLEIGLVLYLRKGLRRTGATLTDLIGTPLLARRHAVADVALGVALWGG
ncbi:MAG: hypothetical protein ABJD07_11040, partial [Gemmatimonadaceae bacterium]